MSLTPGGVLGRTQSWEPLPFVMGMTRGTLFSAKVAPQKQVWEPELTGALTPDCKMQS